MKPPVAPTNHHTYSLHGVTFEDPYYWLRKKGTKKVTDYLNAENAYTDSVLAPIKSLQEKLYTEMLSRVQEDDIDPPHLDHGYWYYSRIAKGQQYPVHCRKKGTLEAKEEIILDVNELAVGKKFLSLEEAEVSEDTKQLAYSIDFVGSRDYALYVKNLETGVTTPKALSHGVGSAVWANDNKTLYYTVEDKAKRQYRMYRHKVGSTKRELVYEEKDERFDIEVERSRSARFLFLASVSKLQSEYRYLDLEAKNPEWKVFAAREPDHEYHVDHRGDYFYIRSNAGAKNYQLFRVPVSDPQRSKWEVVLPHRPNVMLAGLDVFRDFIVLAEREDGLPQLTLWEWVNGTKRRIEVPETAFDIYPAENAEWEAKTYRYGYQSAITPRTIYDYDVARRSSTLVKRQAVLGGYDPVHYTVERLEATAADGTKIPISLAYKKGARDHGPAPLVLQGYGAYGLPEDVYFSNSRLNLLNRGVIFAQAHIRGGGEFGDAWHDAGKMTKKMNTFTDFIACADHLVKQHYTSRDKLVIQGGSAGGLLVGAVLNMRPDLCKGALLLVPFVDVLNTMLDETLPLTVSEFEEWGNPKKDEDFQVMRTYSPYDNLRKADYPSMMVRTSLNDSQVMYWEPAKYTAKLRSLKTDTNPLLFQCNMDAGHGGSSGRYEAMKESAFDQAWALWTLGVNQ